jgi:DnaK suppressor protein
MTHDQLFVLRQTLTSSMERILSMDQKNAQAISESYHACPDLNDRASLESDRHMLIILGQHKRKLIRQIKDALFRMDEGSYGICQECGENIPLKRLEVQPTSSLCIFCQEDMEKRDGPWS